ncbi:MAG: hydratase [Burkholderiales bacterium]|nr:MAG: hydratase [Burkholderiales bacterium]
MDLPSPETLLAAADAGRSLPAVTPGGADPADLDAALRTQAAIGALRRARGETQVGWKIGFTNRTIWPLYGVQQPIWGPVWDTTLRLLEGNDAQAEIARLAEPRLEPEIVLGLEASPPPDADAHDAASTAALLACVDWVAHGFEIVHSVWPGWKFGAAQGIAAQALHGGLLVGPRVPVAALGPDPAAALSALRLELWRDGARVAEGVGANVLDGPLQALGHLVAGLAARGERIAAGSVVTTGTLTDAQPLAAGQVWRTEIAGVPLPGLTLRIG